MNILISFLIEYNIGINTITFTQKQINMNREILFRGKRVDNGEWVFGGIYKNLEGKCFIITGFNKYRTETYFAEVTSETVGQYTGLKDKNGIKIFEGDKINYTLTKGCSNDDCGLPNLTNQKTVVSGMNHLNNFYSELEITGKTHD